MVEPSSGPPTPRGEGLSIIRLSPRLSTRHVTRCRVRVSSRGRDAGRVAPRGPPRPWGEQRLNTSTLGSTDRLKLLAVSQSGFVFDPRTGHSYTANSTGHAVLRALQEGRSLDEAAAEVRAGFEAEGEPVEDDVEAFLRLLGDLGLTGRKDGPAPSEALP